MKFFLCLQKKNNVQNRNGECPNILFKYCAFSDIFLSDHFLCCCLLLSAAAEAPIFCDTWQFNHDGRDKRELQEMSARCGSSSLSRQLFKRVAAAASVVAWKCCPKEIAPHREVHGFPKGKYGPDLWQASLTNVLPPFRRQFFLPAPIVFPRCGFCLAGTPPHPHPPNPQRLISILMPFIFSAFPSWLLLFRIRFFPMLKILCDGACSVLLPTSSETTNVIWEMSAICWHQSLAAGIAVNRDINRMPVVMGEDTRAVLSLRTCGPLDQYFQQPS